MRKNKKDEETIQTHQDPNSGGRRRFINQALAASAGIAISRFLPHLKTASVYASSGCAPSPFPPNELVNPGEIVSNGKGVLQSVLVVKGEERTVPTVTGKYMLRAYEGYRGFKIDPKERVTKPGVYGPGPTFRASVGDRKSTRLNSSHANISYAVFCLKKKKTIPSITARPFS